MEFEKHIKDNLSDQRSEINASKMWENVSDRIDSKKKKRRGFLLWFSGIGLASALLLLFSYTYLFQSDNNSTIQNIVNNSKEIHTNKIITPSPSLLKNEPSDLTSQNLSRETVELEEKIISKISPNKMTHSSVPTKVIKTDNQDVIITNPSETSPSLSVSSTFQTQKEILKNNQSQNLRRSIKNHPPLQKEENKKLVASFKTSSFETLNRLPSLALTLLEYRADLKDQNLRPVIYERPIIDKSKYWTLSLMSRIGLSNKELISEDSLYAQLRNQTETSLEHFNFKAGLHYQFNKNWAVGSGLDYLKQTEKFEWEGDYTENVSGTYIDTIYYSSEQDSTVSSFTGNYTATIHRKMIKYNQYHFINIPLSIKYHFQINDHAFTIQPEVLFNIAYKAKGDYLNNFGVPSQLKELKSNSSVHYQLGLHYRKAINNSLDILLGCSARWLPNTVLGENAVKTESNYLFYNLSLGVSKRI